MADGYLLEAGVDKYLLEDGSGVYLLDVAGELYTFEGPGVNGDPISTTYDFGGGITFDGGADTTGGTATFSNAQVRRGSLSLALFFAAGGSSWRYIDIATSDQPTLYHSFYWYVSSGAWLATQIAQYYDNAGTRGGQLYISGGLSLTLRNPTAQTGTALDMSSLAGQWVRFDHYVSGTSGTSTQTLRVYAGATIDSTNTADAFGAITDGVFNTIAGIKQIRLGSFTTVASAQTQYFDDVAWALTAFPTPPSAPPVTNIGSFGIPLN